MTQDLPSLSPSKFNYSYQHLQGVMLKNLNKIAYKENLTHSEYRVMGILIGYWNKKQEKAFPSKRMLATDCRMSNITIKKALETLTKQNLITILKETKTARQYYYINQQKLLQSTSNRFVTPCCTAHVNKLIKNKTYKEHKSEKVYKKKKDVCLIKKRKKANLKLLISDCIQSITNKTENIVSLTSLLDYSPRNARQKTGKNLLLDRVPIGITTERRKFFQQKKQFLEIDPPFCDAIEERIFLLKMSLTTIRPLC